MSRDRLATRVAVVTGAGRGLGRAHALLLAAEGARVVVNDVGAAVAGGAADATVAKSVVDEIVAAGGVALASSHDISEWQSARALVAFAVEEFGRLDVLVNNAGNARPVSAADMTEDDWDTVVDVHLKGHAAMSTAVMAHWRSRAASGTASDASIVHTSSLAGLSGVAGTASYAAAKAGIIGLSKALAVEGAAIGVRSNVVSPVAHTRLTSATHTASVRDHSGFLPGDPANVAPLVGWLASPDCPATDQVFHVVGRQIVVLRVPAIAAVATSVDGAWTLEKVAARMSDVLIEPVHREDLLREIEC